MFMIIFDSNLPICYLQYFFNQLLFKQVCIQHHDCIGKCYALGGLTAVHKTFLTHFLLYHSHHFCLFFSFFLFPIMIQWTQNVNISRLVRFIVKRLQYYFLLVYLLFYIDDFIPINRYVYGVYDSQTYFYSTKVIVVINCGKKNVQIIYTGSFIANYAIFKEYYWNQCLVCTFTLYTHPVDNVL